MSSRALSLVSLYMHWFNVIDSVSTSRRDENIVLDLALEVVNEGLAIVEVFAIVVINNVERTGGVGGRVSGIAPDDLDTWEG